MTHVIVLGAGLGGMPMALKLKQQLHETDKLIVVCNLKTYQFAPSNPWLSETMDKGKSLKRGQCD